MLPPDSVANIRAVLDADTHAFPVWCVRALRLLLDDLDATRDGHLPEGALDELNDARRRLSMAKQMLVEWQHEIDTAPDVPPDSDAHHYRLGHVRAMRSCLFDLRTVLTGGGGT